MKKFIGLMIMGGLLLTAVPAFAEDNPASSVQSKVQQLQVDITGLNKKEAVAKVKAAVETRKAENQAKVQAKLEAVSQKLGVDINGLTKKEAVAKLKTAAEAKKAEKQADMQAKVEAAAQKLG